MKVIWPEESDKIDQLTTIKSSSPTDDSSATADQCGCEKKSHYIFRIRPGLYH